MNRLNRDLFFKGFRKQLKAVLPAEKAELIWAEAGEEYDRILKNQPEVKIRFPCSLKSGLEGIRHNGGFRNTAQHF